jgi:DNA-directed RNA polymerase subunit RPC12/RpoP
VRSAGSLKPATYRCPFCGGRLLAMERHLLVAPEDDARRRRHAHAECVARERRAGRLPSRDEWRATLPREPSLLARLLRRG